MVATLEILAAG